ncbi:hypothetical protein ACPPVS_10385 [Cellulomonas sp. McL0617]|uniref:hypothetical protein n=1 Tax=Cellulomonas sp. McL0617 TaxID=3415675 RepID=UPI003CFA5CA0
MADPTPGAQDLVRRIVDANVTYMKAWGSLVTDWLSEVSAVATAAPGVVSVQTPATTPTHTHAPSPAEPAGAAVLVLEGPAGAQVAGAFEVENVLDAEASGVVVVDPFRDLAGQPVDVEVAITPTALDLAAGESVIVSVRATVPATAVSGVDHRSTVRVEGIPAGTIAVVLRRTDD